MNLKPCGTHAAYIRHWRHGEDPCDECLAAHSAATVKYRRTSPAANRARARALVRLKAMHPGLYRALYAEEMGR